METVKTAPKSMVCLSKEDGDMPFMVWLFRIGAQAPILNVAAKKKRVPLTNVAVATADDLWDVFGKECSCRPANQCVT